MIHDWLAKSAAINDFSTHTPMMVNTDAVLAFVTIDYHIWTESWLNILVLNSFFQFIGEYYAPWLRRI